MVWNAAAADEEAGGAAEEEGEGESVGSPPPLSSCPGAVHDRALPTSSGHHGRLSPGAAASSSDLAALIMLPR